MRCTATDHAAIACASDERFSCSDIVTRDCGFSAAGHAIFVDALVAAISTADVTGRNSYAAAVKNTAAGYSAGPIFSAAVDSSPAAEAAAGNF